MSTARSNVGGSPAGTQSSALAAGGLAAPGTSTATEEYTGTSNPVTKTITTS